MSYILDALKRAESERRLGAVPGVHSAPAFDATRTAHRPRLLWILLPASILALVGAVWFGAVRAPIEVPATLTAPAATPGIAKQSGAQASPLSSQPVAAAAPVAAPPAPPPRKTAAASKPAPRPAKQSAAPKTAPASAAPADPPLQALRDLPEQLRRELPAFTVGGYIYSANKADRSVLIDKRLLREGNEIAPGLTLEQLTPNGMVLQYKGYRYRAAY